MKTLNHKYSIFMLTCAALMAPAVAAAQTKCALPKGIQAENVKAGFTRSGKSVGLDMTINLESLKIGKNQRVVLRPMLCGTESPDTIRFTPIVINGRNAAITYQRNGSETVGGAMVVNASSASERKVSYKARAPFEEWMNDSKLYVVEDVCGCGKTTAGSLQNLDPLAAITPQTVTAEMTVSYKVPAVEAVKERKESGSAYVAFPVNQTVIRPTYFSNEIELNKILNTIEVVRSDSHISIEQITIHGYASPEGTYSQNAQLASGRSQALTAYVASISGVSRGKFRTESTPEDWDGLTKYLQESSMASAPAIIAIINGEADPDKRESLIRQRYPADYQRLLTEVYPALRHSDYTVRYTVRPFTLQEMREYINTHPQYLSLDEYFTLANSYTDSPAERAKVLYKAAAMFPDDATAQLNAACVALENGENAAAERYLLSAGSSAEADNARGIVEMRNGNTDAARRLLDAAAAAGCKEAAANAAALKAMEAGATLYNTLDD
jgi:outer membrane protein OmpA-like peptidoglycan-associated protein